MEDNLKHKTRVLFINGPLGGGGAEKVMIDILNNLDYSKYEVDLCLFVNGGILLQQVPKDVAVFYIWPKYNISYKLAYRFSIWFRLNFLLRRFVNKKIKKNYDITISFLEGIPLKLHTLLKTDAVKISWVHADLYNFPYEKEVFYKGEEEAAYNQMDQIICVSNDAGAAFKKRFKNVLTSCLVIYNLIDIENIKEKANAISIEKSRFTVVVVGRITMIKRMDRVIGVAAICKERNVDVLFRVVGDGELLKALQERVNQLELHHWVEFTGYQPNPYPYIRAADVLLSCSAYEGFGLVICEAMALGIPVIATRTAGSVEILNDNQFGIICEHDCMSIFEAFYRLYSDRALRDHYAKAGIERVQMFESKKIIEQIQSLIDERE